jgi:hypothetical protein
LACSQFQECELYIPQEQLVLELGGPHIYAVKLVLHKSAACREKQIGGTALPFEVGEVVL